MKKLLAIFLSIAFIGLVLQSCGAKNSETADSSNTEANEEEMVDQQSESEFPYELVPLKYERMSYLSDEKEWYHGGLAVKQDGKFVAFDNDADYSGLAKEGQLYSATYNHLPSDVSDEELKTIAHLIQQYLRDKSKIREHELFTDIDKAYYNCSEYFSGDYYLDGMGYHRHTYTNGVRGYWGSILFICQTPSEGELKGELQTLDGEIVPADALILVR